MAFASGSGVRIAAIAESTFGTTPATPTFKTLRTTTGSLASTKVTVTSDERQADENVADEVKVGVDAAGSYGFELSYGTFDDLLEGMFRSTWSSNVLTNGITDKSFTIEEMLTIAGGNTYSRFRGVMVNTFGIDFASRAKVTGTIGLMGVEETRATAIVTGATYTAASTTPMLNSSSHIAGLTLGGLGLGSQPVVRRVALEFTNGLRTRPAVGTEFSAQFGRAQFGVTGTIEAYFDSNALYEAMLTDAAYGSLTFTIGEATTQKYTISIPKLRLGSGARPIGGNTDDVVLSIPFRGLKDSGIGGTCRITRAVA